MPDTIPIPRCGGMTEAELAQLAILDAAQERARAVLLRSLTQRNPIFDAVLGKAKDA